MNNGNNKVLSPREQADHERSVHDYPDINFSPKEYVIIDVERSYFCLMAIWIMALLMFLAIAATIIIIDLTSPLRMSLELLICLLCGAVIVPLLYGFIGSYIYKNNCFIITNERVFAYIQLSLFSRQTQTIELDRIEDCSYGQNNVLQMMFNYGTIRLSTIGDEQTYIFTCVHNPSEQFKVVNKVVQSVSNSYRIRNNR